MEILQILQYVVLGAIPGAFWLWFFYTKDKNPEPIKKVIKVFFYGMLITIPAMFFQLGVDMVFPFVHTNSMVVIIITNFVIIAASEEFCKYIVVKRTVYKENVFDEPFDGIIYMVSAALGFAVLEDILVGFSEGPDILILRFVTATLLHAVTGAIIGYYLGRAKFEKQHSRGLIATGLVIAIAVHGLYNTLLYLDPSASLWLVFGLLIIIFVIIWLAMKKSQNLGELLKKNNGDLFTKNKKN